MRFAFGVAAAAVLSAVSAAAQERGWLAIGTESVSHAFSFRSPDDAVNACGFLDCELVETFTACLAVAYSNETASGRPAWTWMKASTRGDANRGAQDECEDAGGLACSVSDVVCVAPAGGGNAVAAPPAATPEQETAFWQSIADSTNPAEFEAYLTQFPNGVFRALAEARLAALRASPDDVPAAAGRLAALRAPVDTGPGVEEVGDFGDDAGVHARDGECDDPRFEGPGAPFGFDSHRGHDATDCRELFESGRISWRGDGEFGDDSGEFANDGDFDDTRFVGDRGGGALNDDSHIGRDATDCRNLLRVGRISWSGDAVNTGSSPGRRSVTDGSSDDFSTSVIVSNCANVGTRVCIENRSSQRVFVRFCTPDVDGRYKPGLCGHTAVRANDGYVHQGSTDHVAETYWRACALDNAKEAQEQACYFELPR